MAQKLLEADMLLTEVDISTFWPYYMQSVVLHTASIALRALDVAGNTVLEIRSLLSFFPSITVGNKIVREFADNEGKTMATSTGRAAATSFISAGLAGIASHSCRSFGCQWRK